MSETPPASLDAARPAGPKRPSRGCLIVCGIIVVALAYILSGPLYPPGVNAAFFNSHSSWEIRHALANYEDDHNGQLPPTFSTLIPKYLQEENFPSCGYHDERGAGLFQWLYYPRAKFENLSRDTILLAAPRTSFDFLWRRRRLVMYRGFFPYRIPEADFQRLIHEQNPPPAK